MPKQSECCVLSREEAKALYELIDQLSGGNAGNTFLWDGTDSWDDPTNAACAKLYSAAGADIPESMKK